MKSFEPIRLGVCGLGGHGARICDAVVAEAQHKLPRARLAAVSEIDLPRYSTRAADLKRRGVALFDDFDEMLADEQIEAVWLPLPIDLHRSFTERALAAGKPVMCEKPAAGAVQDVDAMIVARDRHRLPVWIGFQDVYQPAVREVKRRIVRGEFGVVLSATVIGCWPRGDAYYTRNGWVGRIAREGRWVLDSPANNAMAHYLHLAQFLLGPADGVSAVPSEVEAELYRINEIENYDTCSLRLTFDNGVHLLAGLTHASATAIEPEVVIRTQFARIRCIAKRRIEIERSGITERLPLDQRYHAPMFSTIHQRLRNRDASVTGGTLEMARAHTVAINAASEAAPVVPVDHEHLIGSIDEFGSPSRAIRGIEAALRESIEQGRMLHESRAATWSRPGGDIPIKDYTCFNGPFAESQAGR